MLASVHGRAALKGAGYRPFILILLVKVVVTNPRCIKMRKALIPREICFKTVQARRDDRLAGASLSPLQLRRHRLCRAFAAVNVSGRGMGCLHTKLFCSTSGHDL